MPIDNWAVRRECFEQCGNFDESLPCAEDWDLLLRLSAQFDFQQIAEMTTEVRVREEAVDSVSKRNPLRPVCELLYRRYARTATNWWSLRASLPEVAALEFILK